ncbi:MAG: hypothetical protein Q8L87_19675 [Anaerolineales bacterium]|jgi:hypothetical protein|nr:hypothetical protein [Anaerolineales bacterium]
MSNRRWYVLQGNSLEGTGRDAQTTVVTTFDINVWRLIEVDAHDGAHLANLSRETGLTGLTRFNRYLNANLSRHCFLALEHQYFVRRDGPLAEQIQTARLHAFHKSIRPETSGLLARPSGCDFPALRQ